MRSDSGVTPITIFTKPAPCGGDCLFCPTVPEVPKSYLPRVNLNKKGLSFSPKEQMVYWLSYLQKRGGTCNKLEIIILGGSFVSHTVEYIKEFIKDVYACVDGGINQDSSVYDHILRHQSLVGRRIIGITVEARPDQITGPLVDELFSLGITKIEIGVQSTNPQVLEFNNRGHSIDAIRRSTSIIKNKGLKVGYHLLYGLPKSSIDCDIETTKDVFTDPDMMPDHVKLYFCEMFKKRYMSSAIVSLYDNKEWQPYSANERNDLLKAIIPIIPRHVRVSRIGRKMSKDDFESEGLHVIRDVVEKKFGCRCIRCREPRQDRNNLGSENIITSELTCNDIYIELNDTPTDTCVGTLRLRLVDGGNAIIRELHVYGPEADLGKTGTFQHQGAGSKLLGHAERIAKEKWGAAQLGVASGVGVRRYYLKHGFELAKDNLMWKKI